MLDLIFYYAQRALQYEWHRAIRRKHKKILRRNDSAHASLTSLISPLSGSIGIMLIVFEVKLSTSYANSKNYHRLNGVEGSDHMELAPSAGSPERASRREHFRLCRSLHQSIVLSSSSSRCGVCVPISKRAVVTAVRRAWRGRAEKGIEVRLCARRMYESIAS